MKLPRYVQRVLSGRTVRFRGWYYVDGMRYYLPLVSTPERASQDVQRVRRQIKERRRAEREAMLQQLAAGGSA